MRIVETWIIVDDQRVPAVAREDFRDIVGRVVAEQAAFRGRALGGRALRKDETFNAGKRDAVGQADGRVASNAVAVRDRDLVGCAGDRAARKQVGARADKDTCFGIDRVEDQAVCGNMATIDGLAIARDDITLVEGNITCNAVTGLFEYITRNDRNGQAAVAVIDNRNAGGEVYLRNVRRDRCSVILKFCLPE